MENHEYGSIIGSKSAPYLNSLAAKYALLTDYYATTHPSEPNYIAMVAGSTLGVTGDGTYNLSGDSLFRQLAAAGIDLARLRAGLSRPAASPGSSAAASPTGPARTAATRASTTPRSASPTCRATPPSAPTSSRCANFDPAAGTFAFITPNLINDMHDGSVAQGDAFLRDFVPLITEQPRVRERACCSSPSTRAAPAPGPTATAAATSRP